MPNKIVRDALRKAMLEHTTAEGFSYSGTDHFSFEWPASERWERWVLHIVVNPSADRLILSGEDFGVTVCSWFDLPFVLDAVETLYPKERGYND